MWKFLRIFLRDFQLGPKVVKASTWPRALAVEAFNTSCGVCAKAVPHKMKLAAINATSLLCVMVSPAFIQVPAMSDGFDGAQGLANSMLPVLIMSRPDPAPP